MTVTTQVTYVGTAAFAHKGGIHVAAVERAPHSYEHIEPEVVGNKRKFVISELAGRGNVRVRYTHHLLFRGIMGYAGTECSGSVKRCSSPIHARIDAPTPVLSVMLANVEEVMVIQNRVYG